MTECKDELSRTNQLHSSSWSDAETTLPRRFRLFLICKDAVFVRRLLSHPFLQAHYINRFEINHKEFWHETREQLVTVPPPSPPFLMLKLLSMKRLADYFNRLNDCFYKFNNFKSSSDLKRFCFWWIQIKCLKLNNRSYIWRHFSYNCLI